MNEVFELLSVTPEQVIPVWRIKLQTRRSRE